MNKNKEQKISKLKKDIKRLEKKYNQIKNNIEVIPIQYNIFDEMMKEYKNSLKKKKIKKEVLKITITEKNIRYEYEKIINYVQKNEQSLKKSKINSLTNSNITDEDLIQAQINNEKKYKKIKNDIINTCQKCMNSKLTTNEFTKVINLLGTDIKNKIIYETYHSPENFIPLKEAEKSDENSFLFINSLISKMLLNNNITVAIQKEKENEKDNENEKENDIFSISMIQLISTGKAFKKKLTLSFNYPKEKYMEILSNKEIQTKFITQKKKQYSIALNIPEDKISLTNIRYPLLIDLIITDENEIDIYKSLKNDKEIHNITFKSLLEGCILNENMFDKKGNRYNDSEWGKIKESGPKKYLQKYYPPYGYIGFGLRVYGKFDNGNDNWLSNNHNVGEWYIAYHGTGYNDVPLEIIKNGFKIGDRQDFNYSKNLNPLSNNIFKNCGNGIYLTPDIEEATFYSAQKNGICLNGKQYFIIFMCRVNPYKVRFANKNEPDYWVVGGDSNKKINENKINDEVRPYRILVKEMYDNDFSDDSFY